MALKSYLWILRVVTLLALSAFGWTLMEVDMERAGGLALLAFYGTFLLSFSGLMALLLIWLRRKVSGDETALILKGTCLREGILLGVLAAGLLLLQSFRMLVWWDGLMIVAGVLLVELYFLTRRKE